MSAWMCAAIFSSGDANAALNFVWLPIYQVIAVSLGLVLGLGVRPTQRMLARRASARRDCKSSCRRHFSFRGKHHGRARCVNHEPGSWRPLGVYFAAFVRRADGLWGDHTWRSGWRRFRRAGTVYSVLRLHSFPRRWLVGVGLGGDGASQLDEELLHAGRRDVQRSGELRARLRALGKQLADLANPVSS